MSSNQRSKSTKPDPGTDHPLRRLGAVAVGFAAIICAIPVISTLSAWTILAFLPVLAVAIVWALPNPTVRRALTVGLITTVTLAVGVAVYVGTSPGDAVTVTSSTTTTRLTAAVVPVVPWKLSAPMSGKPRAVVVDESSAWVTVGADSLVEVDRTSLTQLGKSLDVGRHIEHTILCEGHLLVTYDGGHIADVSRDRQRIVRSRPYGKPLKDGSRSGVMACGGGSVYVSMSLEAKVVRLSLDDLSVIARIPVGKLMSGLAYANGVLYGLDTKQWGVYTVNLTSNVAGGWITTLSDPTGIVPLASRGALVTHDYEPHLGIVLAGQGRERASRWSVPGGVRALDVGAAHGVALDETGSLHRFDATTATLDAPPYLVPSHIVIGKIAMASDGSIIGTVPSKKRLIKIDAQVWHPAAGTRLTPAISCLLPF